jgi:hypothetical protein
MARHRALRCVHSLARLWSIGGIPSKNYTSDVLGVDGNGVANINGVAKIMDPRDAIPAAARYSRWAGPEIWYRALFS